MGRPTKLTPEIQEKICKVLRAGNTEADAAIQADVDPDTIRRWKVRGKKEQEGEYFAFCVAIKRARSDAAVAFIKAVKKAATGHKAITVKRKRRLIDGKLKVVEEDETESWEFDWCAAFRWLEVQRADEFARKPVLEIAAMKGEMAEIRKLVKELREENQQLVKELKELKDRKP